MSAQHNHVRDCPPPHPGLLTVRVTSRGFPLQELGPGENRPAEGPVGLSARTPGLEPMQLPPEPGEPVVRGGEITGKGGHQLAVEN